jgi:hypothetical protein
LSIHFYPYDETHSRPLGVFGIQDPPAADSRWPTADELRSALDSLEGYFIEYLPGPWPGAWAAEITEFDKRPALLTLHYRGYPETDQPSQLAPEIDPVLAALGVQLDIEGERHDIILALLKRLSECCGPFVVTGPNVDAVALVGPDADVEALTELMRPSLKYILRGTDRPIP